MNDTIVKVLAFQTRDAVRSRWLLVYTAFFLAATEGTLRFADGDRAILTLTSIAIFVVPLVTLVLGTVYLYGAREFVELLLAQPVSRGKLFAGLYVGLTLPLAAAFTIGVALPLLAHGGGDPTLRGSVAALIGAGIALTATFTGVAFVVSLRAEDRLRGLGAAIGVWLLFSLVYDGGVLAVVTAFGDYPLERALVVLTFANPIDLARVLLLQQLDVSALMGYTGAVFQQLFGGAGTAAAWGALLCWVCAPVALGARAFRRKDF